jgi:hypothetical protein
LKDPPWGPLAPQRCACEEDCQEGDKGEHRANVHTQSAGSRRAIRRPQFFVDRHV